MAEIDPDALLREADHRAKNTLQLISSLVLLQGRRAGDPAVKAALKALQQRITAVSLAHRHVTREDGVEVVELAALVRELAGDMAQSAGRKDLVLELDLAPLTAPARLAAPLALVVNEALANAVTHAFPQGRAGRIRV